MKGLIERSKNKTNLPHMAVFYEKVFEEFGGADGFAKEFRDLYSHDDTRHTDKVRLMCAVAAGVKDLYDRGLTKNVEDEDPSLMTDEQIDAELQLMLEEGLEAEMDAKDEG